MSDTAETQTSRPSDRAVSSALIAAARELPMAWLNQSSFPPKKKVQEVFARASGHLSDLDLANHFTARSVLIDLHGVISGTDPRAGSFKDQARYVAAKVVDAALRSLPEGY